MSANDIFKHNRDDSTEIYRKENQQLRAQVEEYRDYLEWLFDKGEMNHTTQNESWTEYEKWLDEQEAKTAAKLKG